MTDGTGTTTYVADELDRLTSVTSPGAQTVGYRYDLDGSRTRVIYPDGTAVTYTFDQGSRLASLSDRASPSRVVSYGYVPDGHLQLRQRAAADPGPEPAGQNVIGQHTYTLDNAGNRTALAEALAQVGGGSTTNNISYSYDRLYRRPVTPPGATATTRSATA